MLVVFRSHRSRQFQSYRANSSLANKENKYTAPPPSKPVKEEEDSAEKPAQKPAQGPVESDS